MGHDALAVGIKADPIARLQVFAPWRFIAKGVDLLGSRKCLDHICSRTVFLYQTPPVSASTGSCRQAVTQPASRPARTASPFVLRQLQPLAHLSGTPLALAPKEFDVLHLLARHPGRAYSRDYLLQRIWGLDYGGVDRTVDAHVVRLRKKLGPFGDRVATVWGVAPHRTACPSLPVVSSRLLRLLGYF
jgi:hypothetical protein